jgi:hypothetical protein
MWEKTHLMDVAKERSRKGASGGEHPRERAVSIFVDGYLHIESAGTRQEPQHLVDEQLEREQDSVVAKVEGEALDELAFLCGGISEREQEPHGAWRREFPDVAVGSVRRRG